MPKAIRSVWPWVTRTLPVIDAEHLRADLRHHGLETLSERGAAGDELDRTRRVDLYAHAIRGAQAALLDEHREARADRLATGASARELDLELVPFERGRELVEQPDVIAGIVLDLLAQRLQRPVIRHFVDGDGVAAAHVVGIDAEPGGNRIDQPLAHERRLVAAGRAISRRRSLVGQTKMTDRPIGRHPIRAGQNARGHVHDARGMGPHIGALVMKVEVVDRQDASIGIDRRADAVELLARMIGGDEMLAPVLDPFHRPAETHGGDADQDILGIELAANAEAAAHMRFVHVDRGGRALEHARQQVAIAMRDLGGAVQLEDVARGVVAADGAARLQRHAGMAADRQLELDHRWRRAQRRVDVAIALANDRHLGVAAGREFAGLGLRVEQDRQFLDLHDDEIGGVLRDVGIIGDDGGDRLPDIAHLAGCEHRLAKGFERRDSAFAKIDRRHLGDVSRAPDRDHAGQGTRSAEVDGDDPAMGVVRAHDAHVELVRKRDIAGETAAASHQRRVFQTRDGAADPFVVAGRQRPAPILVAAARTDLMMFW